MAQTRSGVSAKQLERMTGVTYKTAWRMFKQIRTLMSDEDKLIGNVEVDESYFQPKPKMNMRLMRGRNYNNPQILFGAAEKGGRVRIKHIPSAAHGEIIQAVREKVALGSVVHSDGWHSYRALNKLGYEQSWIDHAHRQFVRNGVSTQQIENFWLHLKRGIYGVYTHVGPKYLQSYADEYAFRYSHRMYKQGLMFDTLFKKM
jgi:hypothetical protein